MDYHAFYADVANWVLTVNQKAGQLGMQSNEFWIWATDSAGELCNKYDNNPLALKQMTMLIHWLEDVYNGK